MTSRHKKVLIIVCALVALVGIIWLAASNLFRNPASQQSSEETPETQIEERLDTVFQASAIPPEILERMKGKSLPENALVSVADLRYLQLSHYDYSGEICEGEMVCNKAIADDLVQIFRQLFLEGYQIASMRLIDDFDGSDDASMGANNTSCFNYRVVAGSTKLSKHARGLAVDINPIENPCVRRNRVDPPAGVDFKDRSKPFDHKLSPNDLCYKLFAAHGFTWGGNWRSLKDYQHFEK